MSNEYECATIAGSTLKSCLHTCSVPADCVLSNNALQDADNYECSSGVCQYTGCNSNAE
jgi:hypothetical protein